MDTRQMRLFVALAETLHFGRAAAQMGMTQPPFSRQIANLERDLGAQLVERTSRHVTLTAAGRRFLEESRTVLALFENACRDAKRVADGQTGELRLGFMMHAAHRLVPDLVRRYCLLRPDVQVRLHETSPGLIEDRLTSGMLDAGITFEGRNLPNLQTVPLVADRLCLVMPPDHRLAKKARITAKNLKGAPLIAATAAVAPVLRGAIVDYLSQAGVVATFRFEPQLQNTILRLVAAGLGVALVPALICDGLGSDLIARPLANAPVLKVVIKARPESDNPAIVPLLDLARSLAPKHEEG